MDISYILNELGEERQKYFNAVSPPIIQSSNFGFQSVQHMRENLASEMDHPFYTRGHNPTVAILRKKIAALEAAEECLVFSSGSASIAAAVISSVNAGDHVICVDKPYSWTNKLLNNLLPRFQVEVTMVDGKNPQNFVDALKPNTKVFMLESPNSITFEVQDIKAITDVAKQNGITTILDNSYATPLNQQPITLGVDIVVHSASKYLNGHSDVVAGVLCCSRQKAEQIFASEFMTLGGIISPNDAWLMIRGLRTLHIRMERVAHSTPKVVEFLKQHPRVKKVYYPFDPDSSQYELAKKQMKRPAGQFSIELDATEITQAERFCDNLQRFILGCSWGGHESLIFPTCALVSSENYGELPYPWTLVRFYVGLEEPEVLIQDLSQALEKMYEEA